jgi:spore germination protein
MNYLRIILGVVMFLITMSAQGQETPTPAAFCVGVWFPSSEHPGGYDSLMDNLDTINIVHPFWYTPMPDGTIQATIGAGDEDKLAAWREAELPILPSIFSSIFTFIQTPEGREHHIAAIVDLVERFDYDGIDIDYEGFPAETRDDFTLFVEELSNCCRLPSTPRPPMKAHGVGQPHKIGNG